MMRVRVGWMVFFATACALPAQLAGGRPTGACGPERDHCVRPTTWFHLERPASPGTRSPVVPVHAQNGEWVAYAEGEGTKRAGGVVRTELATPERVKKDDLLIVWQPNDTDPLYPESEEQAQTSTTRWLAMVVETVSPGDGTFTIQARPDAPVPLASARRVVESRDASLPAR